MDLPWYNWTDNFRSKISKCWNVCCRCLKIQEINLQTGNKKKCLRDKTGQIAKCWTEGCWEITAALRIALLMGSWITLLLLVEEEVGKWAMRKLIYHDKKLQTTEQFTGKVTHYLTTQLWNSMPSKPQLTSPQFLHLLCADRFDPIMTHQFFQFFWTPYICTWHHLNFPIKVLF